eukprot:GHVN01005737.1.p2 GENE.GHVN01005737.1~~GHVN01005737.1.p2  ORF type:complete len:120 (+),score=24.65 GHVN01005737.1:444-803(+)
MEERNEAIDWSDGDVSEKYSGAEDGDLEAKHGEAEKEIEFCRASLREARYAHELLIVFDSLVSSMAPHKVKPPSIQALRTAPSSSTSSASSRTLVTDHGEMALAKHDQSVFIPVNLALL